jgi:hypothetical protein
MWGFFIVYETIFESSILYPHFLWLIDLDEKCL